MKKILIIGMTNILGGVETFIYNTIRLSDKNKYTFDFLIKGTNNCVYEKEICEMCGGDKHLYFIRKYKEHTFGCMVDLIKFYWKHAREYDCIHLQTGDTSDILYVFPFAQLFRIPVISHSHSSLIMNKETKNRIFRPLLNLCTNKRIACSREAAIWLFGKEKQSQTEILNNGIDIERFRFNVSKRNLIREDLKIGDDVILIGQVGRMVSEKNHSFSIKLMNDIKKKGINAKLVFVGDGIEKSNLEREVKALSLDRDIIFAGVREDVEMLYSALDVFIMPSIFEGLPITGIEAQTAGLLCLFSENIDDQILITDRAYSLSIENNCFNLWEKAILDNYQCATKREDYADYVNKKGYSVQFTVKRLNEIYEGVMK